MLRGGPTRSLLLLRLVGLALSAAGEGWQEPTYCVGHLVSARCPPAGGFRSWCLTGSCQGDSMNCDECVNGVLEDAGAPRCLPGFQWMAEDYAGERGGEARSYMHENGACEPCQEQMRTAAMENSGIRQVRVCRDICTGSSGRRRCSSSCEWVDNEIEDHITKGSEEQCEPCTTNFIDRAERNVAVGKRCRQSSAGTSECRGAFDDSSERGARIVQDSAGYWIQVDIGSVRPVKRVVIQLRSTADPNTGSAADGGVGQGADKTANDCHVIVSDTEDAPFEPDALTNCGEAPATGYDAVYCCGVVDGGQEMSANVGCAYTLATGWNEGWEPELSGVRGQYVTLLCRDSDDITTTDQLFVAEIEVFAVGPAESGCVECPFGRYWDYTYKNSEVNAQSLWHKPRCSACPAGRFDTVHVNDSPAYASRYGVAAAATCHTCDEEGRFSSDHVKRNIPEEWRGSGGRPGFQARRTRQDGDAAGCEASHQICPIGMYFDNKVGAVHPGRLNLETGLALGPSECKFCTAGTYGDQEGSVRCKNCETDRMATPLGATAATECSDCAGFLPCPPGQVRSPSGDCVCAAGHYNTRYNWVFLNGSEALGETVRADSELKVPDVHVARGLEHLKALNATLKPVTPTEVNAEPLPVHLTFVARCHAGDSVPRRSENWTLLPEVLKKKNYESIECMPCTDPELGPMCVDCTNDDDDTATYAPEFPRLKAGFTRFVADSGHSRGTGVQGFEGADIYSCLSGERVCFPSKDSPTGLVLGEYHCANKRDHCCESANYDGYLCQTCASDYHLAADGLSCQECGASYVIVPIVLICVAIAAVALLVHPRTGPQILKLLLDWYERATSRLRLLQHSATAAAELSRERQLLLQVAVRSSWQPVRMLVSYAQVVTQLGPIFDVKFPANFRAWIAWLESLSFSFDMFASKCLFAGTFLSRWLFTVFVVPGCLLLFVLVRYLWKQRKAWKTHQPDTTNHTGSLFFVIFLMYPGVCNMLFSSIQCFRRSSRQPDGTTSESDRIVDGNAYLLAVDNRVMCSYELSVHEDFSSFHGPEGIGVTSLLLIVVFAIGVPTILFVILLRAVLKTTAPPNFAATRCAEQMDCSLDDAIFVIRSTQIGATYGAIVDAFKPQFAVWEPIDLYRKLALVGISTLVQRGSVMQLLVTLFMSFGFFVIHVKCWPMKIAQDNIFRACAELHVFIAIAIALAYKVDSTSESRNSANADIRASLDPFLHLSFVVMIPCAFVATVASKMFFVVNALGHQGTTASGQPHAHLQGSFERYRLGLPTEDDSRRVRRYAAWLLSGAADNKNMEAGRRVWQEKMIATHLNSDQMRDTLHAVAVKAELAKSEELAFHFTDKYSAYLILHGTGIRASNCGQLGGGVSICVKPPHELGWDRFKPESFNVMVGRALWGTKYAEVVTGGEYASKLDTMLVVRFSKNKNPERFVPGRPNAYIVPQTVLKAMGGENGGEFPNTQIVALLILEPPSSPGDRTELEAAAELKSVSFGEHDVRKQMICDENLGYTLMEANKDAFLDDDEISSAPAARVVRMSADVCHHVDFQQVVNEALRKEQGKASPRLWLEDCRRFTIAEMAAALASIDAQCLSIYTLGFYYTDHSTAAQVMVDGSGLPNGPDGSVKVCLSSPVDLGWAQQSDDADVTAFINTASSRLWGRDWAQGPNKLEVMFIVQVPKSLINEMSVSPWLEISDEAALKEVLDGAPTHSEIWRVYPNQHVKKAYSIVPQPREEMDSQQEDASNEGSMTAPPKTGRVGRAVDFMDIDSIEMDVDADGIGHGATQQVAPDDDDVAASSDQIPEVVATGGTSPTLQQKRRRRAPPLPIGVGVDPSLITAPFPEPREEKDQHQEDGPNEGSMITFTKKGRVGRAVDFIETKGGMDIDAEGIPEVVATGGTSPTLQQKSRRRAPPLPIGVGVDPSLAKQPSPSMHGLKRHAPILQGAALTVRATTPKRKLKPPPLPGMRP